MRLCLLPLLLGGLIVFGTSAASAEQPQVALIDLNRATVAELMKLPGIGQGRARDIIERRAQQPFRRPSDLLRIRGIGRRTYFRLKQFIRVEPAQVSAAREANSGG